MKDFKKILREAERQGWRSRETTKGLMLFPPDTSKSPVAIHRTPSDHRALANVLAQMRQRGFRWPT